MNDDTDIVKVPLEFASIQHPTTVIADDTDILVLLVHHLQPDMSNILMLSKVKKGHSVGVICVTIPDVQHNIGPTSV